MKDKTLEDLFYEQDVRAMEVAFEGQMHFGALFSRVITDCVVLFCLCVCCMWTAMHGWRPTLYIVFLAD